MMKNKALLGTVAVAFGLFGGVLLSQPATAQASSTFSRSTLNNPTGYYYTNKGQYAFRWASLKRSGKTYHFISMANFKNGTVYTGGISRYEISRNRRTFSTTFKLYSNAGNLSSATYKFGLYKLSTSKYRVKLYTYKAGKLLSNKGTTYSITRTTKNPFSRMFDAYTKQDLTDQVTNALQKRYEDGYTSVDPDSKDGQKAIYTGVHTGYTYIKDAFSLKDINK